MEKGEARIISGKKSHKLTLKGVSFYSFRSFAEPNGGLEQEYEIYEFMGVPGELMDKEDGSFYSIQVRVKI